jgi:phenylpyruvate tautomerase PptA (4-oxalocrotonate tautomerase family)
MPTYYLSASEGVFSPAIKKQLAKDVTQIHHEETGAQSFFAQVIFGDIPSNSHFVGGREVSSKHVFLHGHIRAGRTDDQKNRLLTRVVDTISDVTLIQKLYIWAYLVELPASQMVEFGHFLPLPGREQNWLEALPKTDRQFMESI